MKKFNKIVVIGPKSIHVENFISLVYPCFNEVIFIGEEEVKYNFVGKSYVVNFRSKNPIKIILNYRKLKGILINEKPDIVHVQSINRLAFFISLIVKKLKKPMVSSAWGSDVLIVPKRNKIIKDMVKVVLNKSSFVTADSLEMIQEIKRLSSNRNVNLVFLGINPIKAKEKEKIIYSNRLHNPLYKINEIIDDFYDFYKKNKDWNLIIGAIGSETENLKKKVEELDLSKNVKFVGWLNTEENIKFYQKAMVYISIPSSDGTAVSLLEAMSAGCIPIVSDLKVSKEWINDNENGIIKKAGEKAVFTRALKLNQQKVANINELIINSKATKEIATQSFYEIYEKLIIGK